MIESLLTRFGGGRHDNAVEAAQHMMYDAWDAGDRKQRIALAQRALELSPSCADAYVLLARETARNLDQAIDLYRQGIEAGEKALGKSFFREHVGHFWGLLETRPYMRARHGLAQALWDKDLRDEALTHYRDMLRLNPSDNQGIRYLLMDCVLILGRDDEAANLLKRYKEAGSAAWSWSRALLAFRRSGDCPESRGVLSQAIDDNAHVAALLLGKKKCRASFLATLARETGTRLSPMSMARPKRGPGRRMRSVGLRHANPDGATARRTAPIDAAHARSSGRGRKR